MRLVAAAATASQKAFLAPETAQLDSRLPTPAKSIQPDKGSLGDVIFDGGLIDSLLISL